MVVFRSIKMQESRGWSKMVEFEACSEVGGAGARVWKTLEIVEGWYMSVLGCVAEVNSGFPRSFLEIGC